MSRNWRVSITRAVASVLLGATAAGVAGAQRASAGFLVGRSWSSMRFGSNASSNGDRVGLSIGPHARLRLHRALSLGAELIVTRKGFERTQPTVHATYVELPLLAIVEVTSPDPALQPYVGLGVSGAVMLGCRRFMLGVDGYHRDACGRATASNIELGKLRRIDVLREARLGVRFAGRSQSVALEARYATGLVDVDPERPDDWRNVTSGVSLRYERRMGSR
jgi:hypothetical protein